MPIGSGVRRRTRKATVGFKPGHCFTRASARQQRSVSGCRWMKGGGHVTSVPGSAESFFGDRDDTAATSLFSVGMNAPGSVAGGFALRRQTAAGVVRSLALAAAEGGVLAQIAVYRTASVFALRYKSATQTMLVVDPVGTGSDNTQDFSANQIALGRPNAFRNTTGFNTRFIGFRAYRTFIENLSRSGRDPMAVLDADWTRMQTRIAASASANGGVSQIFV
jgi:hypothetical protein